ncbi:MAG: ATP-binding cassette domain-containing protein [Deltaproteobacteria bacterium]|nr:ATP-binding cassette domain-containing protein [Deltaproteobacteria bacterium]
MIRVENLVYRYGSQGDPVLRGIDLEIKRGEYPSEGTVLVDGMDTSEGRSLREIRRKVGMVFQNPEVQIVGMTVEEDVAFGPGNLGLPPEEIRRRVEEAISFVGLETHARRSPHDLSSGEQQLLAVAGVLAMAPDCIILDEPTTYLDPAGTRKVLDVVARLHLQGVTLVHITHYMDEIVETDRVVVMDRGRIALSGSPPEVFSEQDILLDLGLEIPDILLDLGLEIPSVTAFMKKLRQMGVPVDPRVLTVEDACREITRLLERRP